MTYKPDLSDLDEESEAAEEAEDKQFDALPDGKYQAEVVKAYIREKNGRRLLTWELRVASGEYTDRLMWRHSVLERDSRWDYIKRDLSRCGAPFKRASELPEKLEQVIGIYVEVQQKTSNNYANVYINKKISEDNLRTEPPKREETDVKEATKCPFKTEENEDEIPF